MGYYGYGNFGDECYAVLYGEELRKAGHSPAIFRLGSEYGRPFGLHGVSSMDDLLGDADVLLRGGGALLMPRRSLLHWVKSPRDEAESFESTRRAIRSGIRLAASSVGGDGSIVKSLSPSYRDEFVRAASLITVRNPEDVATLQGLGVASEYFPDLLWLLGENVSTPVHSSGGMRIAFDFYPSTLLRNFAPYLVPLLRQLVNRRKDCQFYFLDSTTKGVRPYAGLARLIGGSNVRRHQFSGFEDSLEFLGSLDLLVSSRLHVPMAALQFGVPVLSVLAEKKTLIALANSGLSHLSFGHRRMPELYRLLSCRKSLDVFLRDYRFPDLPSLRAGASGHIRRLNEWLAI